MWFNSMVNSAGGQILTQQGGPGFRRGEGGQDDEGVCATSQGADPSLNVSIEGPGQVAFQNGTAAFMINYPFVWSATQAGNPKVFKDMGYAYFPQVTPDLSPKVSIGGVQPRHRPSPSTRTWPSRRSSA